MKQKLRAQVKSRFYYIFWGTATIAVVLGQLYVGTGYRILHGGMQQLMNKVDGVLLHKDGTRLWGYAMSLFKIDYKSLVEPRVKTTPENVQEANTALFRAKMTLPAAAKHCGMTEKEMKLTFWEFLKYNESDYEVPENSITLPRG